MASILVVEEIAKVDPAIAVLVDIQNTLINTLFRKIASPMLQDKYLPRVRVLVYYEDLSVTLFLEKSSQIFRYNIYRKSRIKSIILSRCNSAFSFGTDKLNLKKKRKKAHEV